MVIRTLISLLSHLSDSLGSNQKFNTILKDVHVHTISIWDLAFDSHKLDDVLILNLHSWKHVVEESIQVLVDVVVVHALELIVKLLKVWGAKLNLVPGVETLHL
jgi:hypothetical protein